MIESGNYPTGAEYDPNAPWNQEEQPEREVEVTVIVTLSKTMKVKVNDYVVRGVDENGIQDIDYYACNLNNAVREQHYLPQEVCKYLETNHKSINEDFKDWVEDDFEVILEKYN